MICFSLFQRRSVTILKTLSIETQKLFQLFIIAKLHLIQTQAFRKVKTSSNNCWFDLLTVNRCAPRFNINGLILFKPAILIDFNPFCHNNY